MENSIIAPFRPALKPFAGELWMSLRDFENHLADRQIGCEIEMQKRTVEFEARVDGIRR